MPVDYDFSGLTPRQQELLTFEGWTVFDAPTRVQPAKRTVRKLIEQGLLKETRRYRMGLWITEYFVPLGVHMAWCSHCARAEA
jgi:hypothetical protein